VRLLLAPRRAVKNNLRDVEFSPRYWIFPEYWYFTK
jgi:hypothetical protein